MLRKTAEAKAKKTTIEAEALRKAQGDFRTTGEFRFWSFMDLDLKCNHKSPPIVEVIKKPSYGSIVMREDTVTARVFANKDLEHCTGSTGRGLAGYFVVGEKHRDRTDVDTFSLRVRFASGVNIAYEFSADLGTRVTTRTKATKLR